ncbi:HesA/MoeB/ThiF family protein [uncultured Demequina sp.]|uniref:HesA/MoeB/ThiF family protein n=1 Tax=uncultured Demequina sp. TaxID=693499 RepID=UPI0025D7571E|nr:HesA/MoeB/ThiF family protein [uncultured Demequina sp.]
MTHSSSERGLDPFARQRGLSGFGAAGQRALAGASVAVVGMGGLGCPAAQYLAAAGVGRLTLIDADHVSVTNLHRQILFGPDAVGRPKVHAAVRALRLIAPGVDVRPVAARLDAGNAHDLLAGHDAIVDGTDTFTARHVIADAAEDLGIPLAWGAVQGWHGQVTVFTREARMRDLFPEEPGLDLDTCDGGAVLGTLCGQVGAAMATEALKAVSGVGTTLAGTLAVVDARNGRWREIPLAPAATEPREPAAASAVGSARAVRVGSAREATAGA